MYPRITDLLRDLFGINPPIDLYSYGLMLAVSILLAAWLTKKDLDRKYNEGLMAPVDLKERTPKGTRTVKGSPGGLIWTIILIAAVFGVLGAKLFHIFENFGDFLLRPASYIFSGDGLTFYGGMIAACIAGYIYLRKKNQNPWQVFDSAAPGLMLAYGTGRIGCYLAGDGDWGICSSLADKPFWIPDFLWSETFPRNYLGIDLLAECGPGYDGVYPTMLYEFAMAAILAGVLWKFRRHLFAPGWLFSMYLVFAGAERFLIEQIRVNVTMFRIGSYSVTQAMFISIILVIVGVIGMIVLSRRKRPEPLNESAE